MYLDHGLLATDDAGVVVFAGSVLGGGTTINWTSCFDPPAWLRSEWASRHGLDGFDGPEAEADLAALRDELGYVEPPWVPPKDQVIIRGASELGWHARQMERNASECGDCGGCGYECRRRAKQCRYRFVRRRRSNGRSNGSCWYCSWCRQCRRRH